MNIHVINVEGITYYWEVKEDGRYGRIISPEDLTSEDKITGRFYYGLDEIEKALKMIRGNKSNGDILWEFVMYIRDLVSKQLRKDGN